MSPVSVHRGVGRSGRSRRARRGRGWWARGRRVSESSHQVIATMSPVSVHRGVGRSGRSRWARRRRGWWARGRRVSESSNEPHLLLTGIKVIRVTARRDQKYRTSGTKMSAYPATGAPMAGRPATAAAATAAIVEKRMLNIEYEEKGGCKGSISICRKSCECETWTTTHRPAPEFEGKVGSQGKCELRFEALQREPFIPLQAGIWSNWGRYARTAMSETEPQNSG